MDNYSKKLIWFLAVLVILISGLLSLDSAISESQTMDEAVHLVAGYSYLKTGDFRINPEHPPLIKLVSALPLLILDLDLPTNQAAWVEHNQWALAPEFLYHNKYDHFTILLLGRLANIIIFMLGGLLLFWFSYRELGPKSALVALTLYAVCPIFLAHSHYITTDVGLAVFIMATLIAFYYYFRQPNWKKFLILAVVFALTQMAKFSALILWPFFILVYFYRWWQTRNTKTKLFSGKKFICTFLLLIIVNILITIAFYGFKTTNLYSDPGMRGLKVEMEQRIKDGTIKDQPPPIPQLAILMNPTKTRGEKIFQWLEKHNLPAYYYLRGLLILSGHNFYGHLAYLNGQLSNGGWWYYFPETFLIKTPLITLILLVMALIFLLIKIKRLATSYCRRQKKFWPKFFSLFKSVPVIYLTVFLFPLIYLGWSMTSKINLGARHLTPLYPCLFIFIAYQLKFIEKLKKVKTGLNWSRFWQRIILALLALNLLSVIIFHPHYIAYFNQLVGGPDYGYKYLLDSNLDWGQQLWALKDYLQEQKINQIYLQYFGTAQPESYGINFQRLPTNDEVKPEDFNGVAVISLSSLYSQAKEYQWLLQYRPTKVLSYSMNVYDLRKR